MSRIRQASDLLIAGRRTTARKPTLILRAPAKLDSLRQEKGAVGACSQKCIVRHVDILRHTYQVADESSFDILYDAYLLAS